MSVLSRIARAGRPARITLALLLLVGLGLGSAARPTTAVAASDRLDIRTVATYTVRPDRGDVSVSVDISATNLVPDRTTSTTITRYYFDGLAFGVPKDARSVAATQAGSRLKVTTKAHSDFAEVQATFRSRLYYKQTARLRMTFLLPGGAPRSDSDTRVNTAFATFYVWAFGDRGDVSVVLPVGFSATVEGSTLTTTHPADGRTILSATGVTDQDWFAWVTADRDDGLSRDVFATRDGEDILIRGWPEDRAWRDEVHHLLSDGLPVLHRLVGLPWPVDGQLEVTEVHTPLLEGYAGFYDPVTHGITMTEDLDDLTILHEASHAWFNDDLFQDRWINEGLADTYAMEALQALHLPVGMLSTEKPGDPAWFPLNSWPVPSRTDDEDVQAAEAYGYGASWNLVRTLATMAGPDGMAGVLAAAHGHEDPYVGAGQAETLTAPADWRRFLDLLEERAGIDADDLFRQWVANDADDRQLDLRATVRTAYAALVEAGGEWATPVMVRAPMAEWHFGDATKAIAAATAALALRDKVAAEASSLGLTPPTGMEAMYESATTDFTTASAQGTAELSALDAIGAATTTLAAPRETLVQVGLLGADPPETTLDAARTAFQSGDPATSTADAQAAAARIDEASRIGSERVTIAGLAIATVIVLLLLLVAVRVIRRRRGRARALALGTASAGDGSSVAVSLADTPIVGALPPPPLGPPPPAEGPPPPAPQQVGPPPPAEGPPRP